MDDINISEIELFVEKCKSNPSILHNPSLAFFKGYLQSLGAQIPHNLKAENDRNAGSQPRAQFDIESEDVEDYLVDSDKELHDTDIVGDPSIEVSEEDCDAAQILKSSAMDAISEGNVNGALGLLTEAIIRNPRSAILYATRAGIFIKLNKPKDALRDAGASLQMNPDSAKGHKMRGIARTMLGHWEEASRDLHTASKLDHDEEIASFLKKVEPNARKIEERPRQYDELGNERPRAKNEVERPKNKAQDEEDPLCGFKEGQVVEIESSSHFDGLVHAMSQASRLTVLYFTATWCGPCRYIAPFFSELARKYPKSVFLKVDIDKARAKAVSWDIHSVPTFFFVKDGKMDKMIGTDKNELEKKIFQHCSS